MAEDSVLKINYAKQQSIVNSLKADIAQLAQKRDRTQSILETRKSMAIEDSRKAFNSKIATSIGKVSEICEAKLAEVSEYLEQLPEQQGKQYAGKYEIKSIEEQLRNYYPQELIETYICPNLIKFADEKQAYAAYTKVEKWVANMKQGGFINTLFNSLNKLMFSFSKKDGMASKLSLLIVIAIIAVIVFYPFFVLTLFSVVGIVSAVQGAFVKFMLTKLYSVKDFLNVTYNEDIFAKDKGDIIAEVKKFLEAVENDYVRAIGSSEFKMNPEILADLERTSAIEHRQICDALYAKEQELEAKERELQEMLTQLEELAKSREESANTLRTNVLETVTWKYVWLDNILTDITPEFRAQACPWSKGNSLFLAKDIKFLKQFWQLAVYQCMLHMHPDYCGQIFLDYKYMGGNLVQFSRLVSSIFSLHSDKESIEQRLERMQEDIRYRCDTILKSCESLEEFNELMRSYDSTGESYVIVHICGVSQLTEDLKILIKNGPRIGYFFKVYLSIEEMKALEKDFPYQDFTDIFEIGDMARPRTQPQVLRLLSDGA